MTLGFQPQLCLVEEVVPAGGACVTYHGNTHTASSSSRSFRLGVHGTPVVSDVKMCFAGWSSDLFHFCEFSRLSVISMRVIKKTIKPANVCICLQRRILWILETIMVPKLTIVQAFLGVN